MCFSGASYVFVTSLNAISSADSDAIAHSLAFLRLVEQEEAKQFILR